ncbi:hypothetical protein [Luteibacter yeojuensis]|uniref:Uncharacterized protein n=1 Tax=Luteibacter yeojuensis TaxID=345309 RepID=A0A0F3KQX5_9GAMM|nr:hypothetical protein [Luteibacter yeojuensis]KJV32524.1 hypothetical protein VI08_12375 [Luteibacter yeojuensis]
MMELRRGPLPTTTRLAIMGIALACAGCGKDWAVVWQSKAVSPSGTYAATAETIQNSGPGTASVGTAVKIGFADGEGTPVDVLTVANPSAANINALRIDMIWRDEHHLEIIYPPDAKLGFRADFYADINIIAHPSALPR